MTESNLKQTEFPPIFIGGAGRSGTTLMVDMLGTHSMLSPIYETEFVQVLCSWIFKQPPALLSEMQQTMRNYMNAWTKQLPLLPHNKRDYERYLHGPHYVQFDREFAIKRVDDYLFELSNHDAIIATKQFILDLFNKHCELDGKPNWVNKLPIYVMMTGALHALFPNMLMLHCVRDGRDVACSVMTRNWGPQTVEESAKWWCNQVALGVHFQNSFPEHNIEVRYEDIINNPKQTLAALFERLNLEDESERILAQYEKNGISITDSRIGNWKTQWDESQIECFNGIAGDTLRHFGYID